MASMTCQECKQIREEIDKRLNSLVAIGKRASAISALRTALSSLEEKKEFAGLLLKHQLIKAEISGLNTALEIHNRLHMSA